MQAKRAFEACTRKILYSTEMNYGLSLARAGLGGMKGVGRTYDLLVTILFQKTLPTNGKLTLQNYVLGENYGKT